MPEYVARLPEQAATQSHIELLLQIAAESCDALKLSLKAYVLSVLGSLGSRLQTERV
jgi:hypothetical protein